MRENPPDDRLLDRYLAGDTTADEHGAVEAWIAANPLRQAVLDVCRGDESLPVDMRGVQRRIEEHVTGSTPSPKRHPLSARNHGHRRWGWVAAMVMALFVVSGGAYYRLTSTKHQTITRSYVTAARERLTVRLSDRTQIQLAPQSRLDVIGQFGRTDRTVRLSGEAFFTVVAKDDSPFIVQTGAVTTRVLGTSFSVQHYDDDRTVHVVVTSGKVISASHAGAVTVTEGHIAMLNDSTATVTVVGDPQSYTDWNRGELVFKDADVTTLLQTVGRWYGYHFKWTDTAIASQHVSVRLRASDPADMMVALKDVLEVTMTIDGDVITLCPRHTEERTVYKKDRNFSPLTERGL